MMFSSASSLDGILPEKTLLKNTYELGEVVGEGGMGVVYHAHHRTLGTEFAVKILDAKLGRIPTIRDRFLEEARIQATLRHPNIVKVTDVIEERGVIGFVMEFIPGYTLDAFIYDVRGALPVEEARDIILAVLDAIGHAHKAGIIHRDLKPSNILVGKGYRPGYASQSVRVMDFGIAKNLEATIGRTVTGAKMGTPRYMAPEQVENASAVDQRADIYALGLTLYEMLCARTPFEDESDYGLLRAHLQKIPPPPSQYRKGIPSKLEALVLTALEKNPDHRFATADAFSNALRRLELGASMSARTRAIEPQTHSKPTRPISENKLRKLAAQDDAQAEPAPKESKKKSGKKKSSKKKSAKKKSPDKAQEALAPKPAAQAEAPAEAPSEPPAARKKSSKKRSSSKKKKSAKEKPGAPRKKSSRARSSRKKESAPQEPDWVFEDTIAPESSRRPASRGRHGKVWLWLGLLIGASVIAIVVAFRQLDGPRAPVEDDAEGSHRRAPLGQNLEESTPFASIEVRESEGGGKMSLAPEHEHLVGRLETDPDAEADDSPTRRVKLPAFFIDQTEIRQSQYARCVTDKICSPHPEGEAALAQHNHPVTGVTFEDAKRFCEWAGKRLPDEEEWEAAARAGQHRIYPFQGEPDCARANYPSTPADVAGDPRCQEMNLLRTVSVYQMEDGKNELHLRHMAGNVREWTRSSTRDGHHIVKGGSFKTSRAALRVSAREIVPDDQRANDLGFRCVMDAR